MGKIKVNGPGRHPLYAHLTATAGDDGKAGDVEWNFEKFAPGGEVLGRIRPRVRPIGPEFIHMLEQHLPANVR